MTQETKECPGYVQFQSIPGKKGLSVAEQIAEQTLPAVREAPSKVKAAKVPKEAKTTKEAKVTKDEKVAENVKQGKEPNLHKNDYLLVHSEDSTEKSKIGKKVPESKVTKAKAKTTAPSYIQTKPASPSANEYGKIQETQKEALGDYIVPPSRTEKLRPVTDDYIMQSKKDYMLPSKKDYMLPSKKDYMLPSKKDYMLPSKKDYIMASKKDYILATKKEPYNIESKKEFRTTKGYMSIKDKSPTVMSRIATVISRIANKESTDSPDATYDKTVYGPHKLPEVKSVAQSSVVGKKSSNEDREKRLKTKYKRLLLLVGAVTILVIILLAIIIVLVQRDSSVKDDELLPSKICEETYKECFYYNSRYISSCELFWCDFIILEPQISGGRLEFIEHKIPKPSDRIITSTNKLPCNVSGVVGYCNSAGKCIEHSGARKHMEDRTVNGEWSSWSSESKCFTNKSIIQGVKWTNFLHSNNYQFRQCLNPKPANGGKLCWNSFPLQLKEWPMTCAKNCKNNNPNVSCSGTSPKKIECPKIEIVETDGTSKSDKELCCDEQEGRCILGSCVPWAS